MGYYLYNELIGMTNNIILIWLSFISYLMSLNYMWCCEDIKKFIAYSTIINMSIIMIYARRMYCNISHIHVISHRLYKCILFLVAGYLLMFNSGNQDIRSISIPISLILVVILIINNLGIIFVFTISTEHLFKILTIPIHILVIPMLTLRLFFIVKITIKLLETLRSSNSNVLTNKLLKRFYLLLLPLIICLCGDKYFIKVQPIISYEIRYYNMLLIMLLFSIPMNSMHKSEIDYLTPIRLDQELS